MIRKQVRTGSASAVAVACQASSFPASTASSSPSASTAPSGETRAASHASTEPAFLSRRPRAAGGRSGANCRASASVKPHMRERRASSGVSGSGSPSAGSCPSEVAPAARNAAGSDHKSASIRPRSGPSMSGRQRARHPSVASSREGSTRPRVVNSRIISAARAANRKSAARAMPDGSAVERPMGSPAAATNVERTCQASGHSRTRPGTVHTGRGSGEAEESDSGSVGSSSSHGEATGPPTASGSRSMSSISPIPTGLPITSPPSSVTASRMPSASRAKGWGLGRGRRGGRPRRAGAVRGRPPSSAHTARRPKEASHTAWRTITMEYCLVRVTLPNSRQSWSGIAGHRATEAGRAARLPLGESEQRCPTQAFQVVRAR